MDHDPRPSKGHPFWDSGFGSVTVREESDNWVSVEKGWGLCKPQLIKLNKMRPVTMSQCEMATGDVTFVSIHTQYKHYCTDTLQYITACLSFICSKTYLLLPFLSVAIRTSKMFTDAQVLAFDRALLAPSCKPVIDQPRDHLIKSTCRWHKVWQHYCTAKYKNRKSYCLPLPKTCICASDHRMNDALWGSRPCFMQLRMQTSHLCSKDRKSVV